MTNPSPHTPALARIESFAFSGIEAVPVTVEVQVSSGLPAFLVVGLADKSVGEARERVRAALTAMGLALPPKRILVNLVPADLVKEGAHFDLPIALGLLCAMGILSFEAVSAYAAVGELSLDGRINPVAGFPFPGSSGSLACATATRTYHRIRSRSCGCQRDAAGAAGSGNCCCRGTFHADERTARRRQIHARKPSARNSSEPDT